jgi:predicted dehydrogenase
MKRVGLVGAGYWGPNLARVLNQTPACDFVAVCDRVPEQVERIARQYPSVNGYANVDEFLASSVDAVVVATPISSHYEIARRALVAGKHVLVEKPLAHSADLAQTLTELAAERNLILMTGHTFVYSPPVVKIRELIESGDLGDIYYVSLSRVNLGLYQRDVDVIWDLAVHDISILLYWLGEAPIDGMSMGRACVQAEKNDVAFLWLKFPSGIVASIEISWLSPQKLRRTCVVGSKRMVVYDDTSTDEKVKIYDCGVQLPEPKSFGEFHLTYRLGDMHAPRLANAEPLLIEVEQFVRSIETGEVPPTDGRFGTDVVRVLEKVAGQRAFEDPALVASAVGRTR